MEVQRPLSAHLALIAGVVFREWRLVNREREKSLRTNSTLCIRKSTFRQSVGPFNLKSSQIAVFLDFSFKQKSKRKTNGMFLRIIIMTAFLQFCMCRNEANVTNCSKNPTQSFRVNKKLSYVLALIVFYVCVYGFTTARFKDFARTVRESHGRRAARFISF